VAAIQARLDEDRPHTVTIPGFRHAAVLVPLILRDARLHLAFLRRAEDGRMHSGQIAFPGGARESTDADVVATALRESHEEVGLLPDAVTPLGRMNDGATISRYVVTPVVGFVPDPPAYRPDPREVQEVFEVPLPFLLDPANERGAPSVTFFGRQYAMFEYHYDEHRIWGFTARLVHDFLEIAREIGYDPEKGSP
jgi:8-oxo-dGTP pyrophosphatase MutT (NUDIX family)